MKNPVFFALVGAGVGIVLFTFFIDAYPSGGSVFRIVLTSKLGMGVPGASDIVGTPFLLFTIVKGVILGAVLGGATGLAADQIKKKD